MAAIEWVLREPKSGVPPSLEAGLLRRVQADLLDRAFVVLRHRERRCSRAATALLDIITRADAPRP